MLSSTQHTHQTMKSALEWLDEEYDLPSDKVQSFQWLSLPSLFTTPPEHQHSELLSNVLQRLTAILDKCFDNHKPIPNKRSLHSSLSQLAQSSSHEAKVKKCLQLCLVSLDNVDEDQFSIVETSELAAMESKDQTISELKQQLTNQGDLEEAAELLRADEPILTSVVRMLQKKKEESQRENDELRSELASKTQKLEENERNLTQTQKTIKEMQARLNAISKEIVASDVIVTFSPNHFRLSGSYISNISGKWGSCFTKPVSTGIHRLSIRTFGTSDIYFGACDASDHPTYLNRFVHGSANAAMMLKSNGSLDPTGKNEIRNLSPREGQEWSAEADMEKRTLHFFLDRVQQANHFINIPVPLVFAIDTKTKDAPIEITFWGELKVSHVKNYGLGHNLR
ncbi:hypothetical protein BLNAU_7159 [Blattamonas nauphoetae]|uniref:Uncharacterized protein n=1 Tax=Blattamonas nauphoetae TaxID=2049346 RepID=A0ABQ9Y2R0_9EUKA|nr:hypothetical protein BLNAU_7159 [Blattamonas nauphoetae]